MPGGSKSFGARASVCWQHGLWPYPRQQAVQADEEHSTADACGTGGDFLYQPVAPQASLAPPAAGRVTVWV